DLVDEAMREVGAEGIATLRWLAGLPRRRAAILLGNHDVVRVAELAHLDDDAFARARRRAREIERASGDRDRAARLVDRFHADFPLVPAPGLLSRDFASWSEEQRALVARLLLDGRLALATTARMDAWPEVEVLATHAGVTVREVELLRHGGLLDPGEAVTPAALAAALNRHLGRAVERVHRDWERGEWTPLDLSPLHVAGAPREEGGGLLFHRPADLESPAAAERARWAAGGGTRPRRFDPRRLPRGLVQVCGHTSHRKSLEDLGAAWASEQVREDRGDAIRLLAVEGDRVSYGPWTGERPPSGPGEASLLLLDAGMHRSPPAEFPLLDLRDA
ncbi:MAG: hypothetical protein ACKOCT_10010, partial [Alphaproteobacteria bacterium]